MKVIRIWDKTSSINLVDADKMISMQPLFGVSEAVFLIHEEGQEEFISQIQTVEQVRDTYGWGRKTVNEVITLYTEVINTPVEPTPSREEDILEVQLTALEGQVGQYEQGEQILANLAEIKDLLLSRNEKLDMIYELLTQPQA